MASDAVRAGTGAGGDAELRCESIRQLAEQARGAVRLAVHGRHQGEQQHVRGARGGRVLSERGDAKERL